MAKKRAKSISRNIHKRLENELEEVEHREERIAAEENSIKAETQKVERLEKEIISDVERKPLTMFGMSDLNKGIIGAFIGVVAHFGFLYGAEIAEYITIARANLLLIFSYLLIIVLMYETGYREIKEKRILFFLPKRATLIYLTSLMVVLIIFFLFNMVDLSKPGEIYKQVAVTSVLAVLGAGTADLIGRN